MSMPKLSLIVAFCHALIIGGMVYFSKPPPLKVRPKSLKVISLKEKPAPLLTQAPPLKTSEPPSLAEILEPEPLEPEPVTPEPVKEELPPSQTPKEPEPIKPEPVKSELIKPEPIKKPSSSNPVKKEAKPAPKKTEPKPTTQKEKAPIKGPSKDKVASEKQTQLRKLMEESLQKLSKKSSSPAATPSSSTAKPMGPLATEMLAFETAYVDELTVYLQMLLILPEKGEVKLKLTLQKNGRLEKLSIVDASSQSNKSYVEKEMAKLTFPPFNKNLRTQERHTFSITLKS